MPASLEAIPPQKGSKCVAMMQAGPSLACQLSPPENVNMPDRCWQVGSYGLQPETPEVCAIIMYTSVVSAAEHALEM